VTTLAVALVAPLVAFGLGVAYWIMFTTIRDEVLAWRYRRLRGIRAVRRTWNRP